MLKKNNYSKIIENNHSMLIFKEKEEAKGNWYTT